MAKRQQSTPPTQPSILPVSLGSSDDADSKPLWQSVATHPITSKRMLNFSSPSRQKKKHRIQEYPRLPGPTRKPSIIDLDSFDTSDMISRTKHKPIFIDLESSDSEIHVSPSNEPCNNITGRMAHYHTAADFLSDEDEDIIWVVGEGFVPLDRYAKPKSSIWPSRKSRLSVAVNAASQPSTNDAKDHTSSPLTDTKSLFQAFNISGDKAIPRNEFHPIATSSITDTKIVSGQLSRLSKAVANLSDNWLFQPDRHLLATDPHLNHQPFSSASFGPDWAHSSGLLDWYPSMQPGQSPWPIAGSSSDVLGMYDEIFSQLPDVFPSKRSAMNMSMPYEEPEIRPEDLQEFYKRAVANIDFAHNATVAEARKALDISDDEDARMDGLSARLMPHQLVAVSWMVAQEKSKNCGGILGDEMGLGKTIQMIATMIKNSSADSKNKSTLILAPLALLIQWKEEIVDKSSRKFKVMIYHQSFTKASERKRITGNDIVITTLDTLRNEWDENATVTSTKKRKGLFSVEWYRVVIDEAQIIRNRTAKKSRAVCALKATYRWCLTGTPIFNTLWDIYPYLRFLRIRPYNDISEFRTHIAVYEKRKPNLATQRAQAVLATCMLRRQKDSKLDGQPLIVLPPKKIEDIMLDLSADERDVYNMLEKQAQRKFNVFLKKGTVLKNFACILVLLLRLRQACGHPSLTIEDSKSETVDDAFSLDPTSERERAISTLGQDWVDNIHKKFETEAEELVEAEKKNSSQAAALECPICNDALDDTCRVTKCGHVFCQGCIETLLAHSDPTLDEDRKVDPQSIQKPCPNCRSPFRQIDTYLKKAFLPPSQDLEDDDETLPVVRRKMRNGVISDSDQDEPSSDSKDTPKVSSSKGKGKEEAIAPELVPSTKILWLLEEIDRLKKEFPSDKIIVISQWTAMLSLCADFLSAHGHRYVQYVGSMKGLERNQSISTFKKQANVSIMLLSLKCGGVGLNLTCANRVVSLDLAWSPASERQAFDRTHRLGQTKHVFVKRIMIKNTVEQRICQLQQKKQDITDNALGEGTGKKLQRLTVGELANLFNLNTHGDALS